jgi:hypothetical protein
VPVTIKGVLSLSVAAAALLPLSLSGDVDHREPRKGSVRDAMHDLTSSSCGLTVKQAAGLTGELYAESELGAMNGGRVWGLAQATHPWLPVWPSGTLIAGAK